MEKIDTSGLVQMIIRVHPSLKAITYYCSQATGRTVEALVADAIKLAIREELWIPKGTIESSLAEIMEPQQPVEQVKK
jgi:hypothetical protein